MSVTYLEAIREAQTYLLREDERVFIYGQDIAGKNYYRPQLQSVAAKYPATFPTLERFTLQELFGNWQKAHKTHFADDGTFDQIYLKDAK